MTYLSRLSLVALVALGASALKAEEPRFGVQGGVNIPTGDLKDAVNNKLGFDLGVHGTFDLGGGHMLRPRLDWNVYPEYSASTPFGDVSNKISNLSLGGDYMYFVDGKPEGLYLTGGLAGVRWHEEVTIPSYGTSTYNTTHLGIALGAGYQWNSALGTEIRYTTSSVNGSNLNAFNVAATIRF